MDSSVEQNKQDRDNKNVATVGAERIQQARPGRKPVEEIDDKNVVLSEGRKSADEISDKNVPNSRGVDFQSTDPGALKSGEHPKVGEMFDLSSFNPHESADLSSSFGLPLHAGWLLCPHQYNPVVMLWLHPRSHKMGTQVPML